MVERVPNQALQPMYLPPLRYGKSAAELRRSAACCGRMRRFKYNLFADYKFSLR